MRYQLVKSNDCDYLMYIAMALSVILFMIVFCRFKTRSDVSYGRIDYENINENFTCELDKIKQD